MDSPKQFYQRNRTEVEKALAVLKSDTLENAVHFAKAEFFSRNPSSEEIRGANSVLYILATLADLEEMVESPDPGLNHNIVIPVKSFPSEKKTETKK